jgi:DNA modification methylase
MRETQKRRTEMKINLHPANCLDAMRGMADNSVDSIVTDPPYGLSFMGKKWDYDVPSVEIWAECLRVLKPGGHLLAFAGTRTQHRMAVRIEDAGFEIRDMIAWVYGSGFPKSLDVSKAIDKASGAEREVVGPNKFAHLNGKENANCYGAASRPDETAPATEAAQQWQGWGTALKPALEPITVARKPLIGTVAENVLEHGTGGLNIDGCRVGTEDKLVAGGPLGANSGDERTGKALGMFQHGTKNTFEQSALGRWPANLIHDGSDEVVDLFPETVPSKAGVRDPRGSMGYHGGASGLPGVVSGHNDHGGSAARFFYCASRTGEASAERVYADAGGTNFAMKPGPRGGDAMGRWPANLIHDGSDEVVGLFPQTSPSPSKPVKQGGGAGYKPGAECGAARDGVGVGYGDSGSAARFFYCAKASRKDRDEGLEGFDRVKVKTKSGGGAPNEGREASSDGGIRANVHPTVKPTALMRYLCRLVTPPGGVVLDPFMGSGSTGKAAILEGFEFVGCEMSPEYFAIARARIEHAAKR